MLGRPAERSRSRSLREAAPPRSRSARGVETGRAGPRRAGHVHRRRRRVRAAARVLHVRRGARATARGSSPRAEPCARAQPGPRASVRRRRREPAARGRRARLRPAGRPSGAVLVAVRRRGSARGALPQNGRTGGRAPARRPARGRRPRGRRSGALGRDRGARIASRPRTAPRSPPRRCGASAAPANSPTGAGHRVLAATRRIPETGWAIVIEVDRGAGPRPRGSRCSGSCWTAGALFAAVTGAGLAWRRSLRLRHYEKLAERDARYRTLLEQTQEAVPRRRGREGGLRQSRLRRHVRLRAAAPRSARDDLLRAGLARADRRVRPSAGRRPAGAGDLRGLGAAGRRLDVRRRDPRDADRVRRQARLARRSCATSPAESAWKPA